jgi:hypothetical protein
VKLKIARCLNDLTILACVSPGRFCSDATFPGYTEPGPDKQGWRLFYHVVSYQLQYLKHLLLLGYWQNVISQHAKSALSVARLAWQSKSLIALLHHTYSTSQSNSPINAFQHITILRAVLRVPMNRQLLYTNISPVL